MSLKVKASKAFIYGQIGESFFGEESTSSKEFVEGIGSAELGKPIDLEINSVGGNLADGIAIGNALKMAPQPVYATITGVAYSAASYIAVQANKLSMAADAMMMIHGPHAVAAGFAGDFDDAADMLRRWTEVITPAYAGRSEKMALDIERILSDRKDHYFTATEALEMGLIDEIVPAMDVAAQVKDFDFHSFKRPETVNMKTDTSKTPDKVATPEPIKAAAPVVFFQKIRERNESLKSTFAAFMNRSGITEVYNKYLENPELATEDARTELLAKLGSESSPVAGPASVEITEDSSDKRVAGMTQSLLARMGRSKPDPKNQYRGMKLLEMARETMEVAGQKTRGYSQVELATKALSPSMMQTTSDFPLVLADAMHKMILTGYEAQPITWDRFCAVNDVSDFRVWNRLTPGMLGNMDEVNEAGTYLYKNLADVEKETNQVTRHGNIISITPEVLINDDTGYIQGTTDGLGRIGARAIERAVYAHLVANGNMQDGTALFVAGHGNLASSGAAMTVALIDAAAVAMAAQTAPGDDAEYLDIVPEILVCHRGNQGLATTLTGAEYEDFNRGKPNRIKGVIRDIVTSPRLGANPWYLFADPKVAPVIEVVFLDGQREPTLTQQESFTTSGLDWKVELPFGVGSIGYRGAYQNPGA